MFLTLVGFQPKVHVLRLSRGLEHLLRVKFSLPLISIFSCFLTHLISSASMAERTTLFIVQLQTDWFSTEEKVCDC